MRPVTLIGDDEQSARWIKRLVRAFERQDGYGIDQSEVRSLALALGWGIRMCRTAQSVVLMHQNGLGVESAPLVRSLFEHAVTIRWLSEAGVGAVTAVEIGHRRHQRNLRDSLRDGSWDLEVIDLGEEDLPTDLDMKKPEEWANFLNLEQRFAAVDLKSWYAIYRIESSQSHPSYLSSSAYWNEERFKNGQEGFGLQPAIPATPLRVTVVFLLVGLQAIVDMVDDPGNLGSTVTSATAWLEEANQ